MICFITMKRIPLALGLLALFAVVLTSFGVTSEERKAYLDKFLQTVPAVTPFSAWLDRTHELPPDYESLPKTNSLPEPLHFLNGK